MKRHENDKQTNIFRERKSLGITLIALVITVVVLIILAGVAINLSLGENGIFNRAKTAKEQYQNAQEYDKEELAKYSNNIDEYITYTRAGGNIINFSTEEKDIGIKWINEKPIYQKTIHFENQNATSFTVPIGLSDIELIFLVPDGCVIDSHNYNGIRQPLPYFQSTTDFISIRANLPNLVITKGAAGNWVIPGVTTDMYVTIRYTKTTDPGTN